MLCRRRRCSVLVTALVETAIKYRARSQRRWLWVALESGMARLCRLRCIVPRLNLLGFEAGEAGGAAVRMLIGGPGNLATLPILLHVDDDTEDRRWRKGLRVRMPVRMLWMVGPWLFRQGLQLNCWLMAM